MSGCASGPDAGGAEVAHGEDARVIAQLAEIAPRDSGIAGTGAGTGADAVTATECWTPSANMLDAETFRVLCRVHFEQQGTERYRDMICIGDLARDPVAEYCYQWAYYADAPKFEDRPAFAGPAAN